MHAGRGHCADIQCQCMCRKCFCSCCPSELQSELPCPKEQNSTLTCMLGGVIMQHAGVDVPLLMQEAPGSPQQATLVLVSKHLCKGTSTGQHQRCEGGPAREKGASRGAAP